MHTPERASSFIAEADESDGSFLQLGASVIGECDEC